MTYPYGGNPKRDIGDLDLLHPVALAALSVAIDSTERRLDLTSWITAYGAPVVVELEARDAACYLLQGDSAVALGATNPRLLADEWRMVTIRSASDAYVAVQRSGSVDGTLVATVSAILS